MDLKLVPGYLNKSYATAPVEDKDHEVFYGNYHRIQQVSEQLAMFAKSVTHNPHVGFEEMDRLLQLGDVLRKELEHVRTDFSRRKNLELLLPSPNTQHHLPCSSMLSPSQTPPSPTAQQSMAMSTNAGTSSPGSLVPQSPTGSTSPHAMMDGASMSITSTGVMQSDEYWRNSRKMDPTKIVRRSPTPLYVNLTEQMILAQSSKRKRPAEGDLFCHNCKTKDTPEWRRGPMGAKTLCNACGIRWRLSQAEASKQRKSDVQLSPTSQSPQLQFPISSHSMGLPSPTSPQSSPTQSPTTVPTQMQVSQSLLHQQQQHLQRQQQQQLQQLQHLQLQQQYAHSHTHHNPPHPQQQHMIVPGPVGLAQENIHHGRLTLSSDSTNGNRSTGASGHLSALSLGSSPIAT